jgi:hypothetical protein
MEKVGFKKIFGRTGDLYARVMHPADDDDGSSRNV